MKTVDVKDVQDIALGAAVLGSGGGGDVHCELIIAQEQMKGRTVTLLSIEEVPDEALVVPVAFMGAPLVCIEKIKTGNEIAELVQRIERELGERVYALMPAEVGGSNCLAPFDGALALDLPIVDADLIGRAFPELQMSSAHLAGISASPLFFTDGDGSTCTVSAPSAHAVERLGRHLTVAVGSSAAIALYLMRGKDLKSAVIAGSLSLAQSMGKALREAREEKRDPIQVLLERVDGRLLYSGKILDVEQRIQDGFLKGEIALGDAETEVKVAYQNEYLLAVRGKDVLAVTPDLLVLLEEGTGEPIPSERICYGQRVHLIALPAPDAWTTEQGLAVAGPKAFGYEHTIPLVFQNLDF